MLWLKFQWIMTLTFGCSQLLVKSNQWWDLCRLAVCTPWSRWQACPFSIPKPHLYWRTTVESSPTTNLNCLSDRDTGYSGTARVHGYIIVLSCDIHQLNNPAMFCYTFKNCLRLNLLAKGIAHRPLVEKSADVLYIGLTILHIRMLSGSSWMLWWSSKFISPIRIIWLLS